AGTFTAPVVSVVGGRGGAGASVLAAALALAGTRRDGHSVLVDADSLGGGLDLLLGTEELTGLRWPDVADTAGRLSGEALCTALPQVAGVSLLTWDRTDPVVVRDAAMSAVLGAARQAASLVVVDLPRRLDDAALQALRDSDVALLVVPAEVRACAAATRVAAAAGAHCADLRVVARGPAPAGLGSRDVAESLGLPLAGVLRPEPGLQRELERGGMTGVHRRGPLARFCAEFLDELTAQRSSVAGGPAAA
ncbi:MAG: septum site-determining protein Ssd, partial [Mycobacteriales bacterium]